MSSHTFHNLSDIHPGSYNWNVKVRVIRTWRGISRSGEAFKGLNTLLVDEKSDRIHAFIPGNVIENHQEKLIEGNICTINNFSVKDYRSDEKFRCINAEKQIIFTSYTKVNKLDVDDKLIPNNMFDFYDLSDLMDIANQNVFLTDVIGVIQRDMPLSNLINKLGQPQSQIKFTIVDGRFSVNVTFWDSLAEEFDFAKSHAEEHPCIVIIASAKITSWQGSHHSTPQVEISNATATKFYLNYDHPNVHHLRKMIPTTLISKYDFSSQIPEIIPNVEIADLKQRGMEYIQKQVICSGKIKTVFQNEKWYTFQCPSCYKEIQPNGGNLKCYRCNNRNVPHPYKKWRIDIQLEDHSGTIDVVLFDSEVRTLIGMNVSDLEAESDPGCPQIIQSLNEKNVTVLLEIKPCNIENEDSSYYAIGIYDESTTYNNLTIDQSTIADPMQESMTQASTSFHLDDFSQLNVNSVEVKKKKKKPSKKKSK